MSDCFDHSMLYIALMQDLPGAKQQIVAFGMLDLAEAEMFTKLNSKGKLRQKLSVPMKPIDGSDDQIDIILSLKFQPSPQFE